MSKHDRQRNFGTPASAATSDDCAHYAARMEKVVDYIGANLDGDLSLRVLASVADVSPFHFHRQFRTWVGLTAAKFIRLMRLRRAALRLAFSPTRSVIDIALEAGFASGESFARAFRRVYRRSPAEFRSQPLWTTYELAPVLARLQERQMNRNVEIVDFAETRVAAVEYQGPPAGEYAAVGRLVAWRRENRVPPSQGMTIGVHYSDPATTPIEDYRIDICVSYDGPIVENAHGVIEKRIPGGRCARIRHLGSREHIPEAEFIYREWLPVSGETVRDFPPFFHYLNVGPDVADDQMITDVYLPLA